MTDDAAVRAACLADLADVLGVLDAAALATDHDRVRASVERGDALVAVRVDPATDFDLTATDFDLTATDADPTATDADPTATDSDDRPVLGALVLVGEEIDAVAVRRRRRDQGIGRALVDAAAERRDRLVAEFDAGVRPFYENLGFEIEAVDAGGETDRYRGVVDYVEE